MTTLRCASISSSHSARNSSGASATPSIDNSSYATTVRMPVTSESGTSLRDEDERVVVEPLDAAPLDDVDDRAGVHVDDAGHACVLVRDASAVRRGAREHDLV